MSIPLIFIYRVSQQFARPEEHHSHRQETGTGGTICTVSREIRLGPRIALQSLRETTYMVDKWSPGGGSTIL